MAHQALVPRVLRTLDVSAGEHPRGQAHLSSASGLVFLHGRLFTVADDEHHLGIFDPSDRRPLRLLRLRAGDLPQDKRARKKRKPDAEALVALPPTAGDAMPRLLALGSGSKPNRATGFLFALDAQGEAAQGPREIDLGGLYDPLRAQFTDLNIEGAFAQAGRFHLLQRGNKGDGRNACIAFALDALEAWLAGQARAPQPLAIQPLALGAVDGVPLGCTDGAALPGGGWIFCAVAEDTDDSYADGACGGSAIGRVDAQGRVVGLWSLDGAPKVEGIALDGRGGLWMVTDADDPDQASRLLALDRLPWA